MYQCSENCICPAPQSPSFRTKVRERGISWVHCETFDISNSNTAIRRATTPRVSPTSLRHHLNAFVSYCIGRTDGRRVCVGGGGVWLVGSPTKNPSKPVLVLLDSTRALPQRATTPDARITCTKVRCCYMEKWQKLHDTNTGINDAAAAGVFNGRVV